MLMRKVFGVVSIVLGAVTLAMATQIPSSAHPYITEWSGYAYVTMVLMWIPLSAVSKLLMTMGVVYPKYALFVTAVIVAAGMLGTYSGVLTNFPQPAELKAIAIISLVGTAGWAAIDFFDFVFHTTWS